MNPSSPITGPSVKVTGPEHFSPLASVRTQPSTIPPCKICHRPSEGARILEMLPGAMSGAAIMQVRFFCRECAPGAFQVMSYALDPHYDVTPLDSGDYILRRLDREAAIVRIKARTGLR